MSSVPEALAFISNMVSGLSTRSIEESAREAVLIGSVSNPSTLISMARVRWIEEFRKGRLYVIYGMIYMEGLQIASVAIPYGILKSPWLAVNKSPDYALAKEGGRAFYEKGPPRICIRTCWSSAVIAIMGLCLSLY